MGVYCLIVTDHRKIILGGKNFCLKIAIRLFYSEPQVRYSFTYTIVSKFLIIYITLLLVNLFRQSAKKEVTELSDNISHENRLR